MGKVHKHVRGKNERPPHTEGNDTVNAKLSPLLKETKTMKSRVTLVAAVLATALTVSACGDGSQDGGSPEEPAGGGEGTVDGDGETAVEGSDVADLVPGEYRERGSFTVGINPDVPPVKYLDDDGIMTGVAPELLRAAGDIMGLEVEIELGSFDSMMPGLQSGAFDVIGSIGDFEERREYIDFINYMHAGIGIIGTADFEQDEVVPEDLCGVTVGYVVGTQQQGLLQTASNECEEAGEAPIEASGYRDAAASILAVSSGQAEAAWIDTPAVLYNVNAQPDVFKALYTEPEPGYYGIGVLKEDDEFLQALHAALQELEANGEYEAIMTEFGVTDLMTEGMPLNQGASIDG